MRNQADPCPSNVPGSRALPRFVPGSAPVFGLLLKLLAADSGAGVVPVVGRPGLTRGRRAECVVDGTEVPAARPVAAGVARRPVGHAAGGPSGRRLVGGAGPAASDVVSDDGHPAGP